MAEELCHSPPWGKLEPRLRAMTRMLVRRHRARIQRVAKALLAKMTWLAGVSTTSKSTLRFYWQYTAQARSRPRRQGDAPAPPRRAQQWTGCDNSNCCKEPNMSFTVISNSFKDGDYLPNDFILSANFGFGCAGANKSPHLQWSSAPADTKSFTTNCYARVVTERLVGLASISCLAI
jgi:hypothetical protein